MDAAYVRNQLRLPIFDSIPLVVDFLQKYPHIVIAVEPVVHTRAVTRGNGKVHAVAHAQISVVIHRFNVG